jgi:hypothetical protein
MIPKPKCIPKPKFRPKPKPKVSDHWSKLCEVTLLRQEIEAAKGWLSVLNTFESFKLITLGRTVSDSDNNFMCIFLQTYIQLIKI